MNAGEGGTIYKKRPSVLQADHPLPRLVHAWVTPTSSNKTHTSSIDGDGIMTKRGGGIWGKEGEG